MLNTYLPQILILIGLLLTFLGGFISFKRGEDTQKENQTLIVENKKLVESNLSLSRLINDNLTGGDSYGVVTPLIISEKTGDMYFLYFENKGKFPLYDVKITYFDPDEVKKHANPNGNASLEILKYYNAIDCGNISQGGGRTLGPSFHINEGSNLKLNMIINAKNGSFSQLLRIIKKKGKLYVAKKLNTIGQNPKVIFEESHPDFPKTNTGEIDWN
jgi:hypothetical protein